MPYIDTSVLVAYYCPEPLSAKVEHFLINAQRPAISQLTEVEFASALAKKIRDRTLSTADAKKILTLFHSHVEQKSFYSLPIRPSHYSKAKNLISQFNTPLRTLDALHLAIAGTNKIPIITADKKLADSANLLSVEVQLIS